MPRWSEERRKTLLRSNWTSTGWVWTGLSPGILGFIPGITTNYDTMQVAGHESAAHLRGIVQISILHNLVHPLFGVVWPWREAGPVRVRS